MILGYNIYENESVLSRRGWGTGNKAACAESVFSIQPRAAVRSQSVKVPSAAAPTVTQLHVLALLAG